MAVRRMVIATIPTDLAGRLDAFSKRMDRSKSRIVVQALREWVAEEDRRDAMTWEGLREVDEGQTIPHEEVIARFERLKRERHWATV